MKHILKLLSILSLSPVFNLYANESDPSDSFVNENVILVTAELQAESPLKLANSVSVINDDAIKQRNAEHLEQLFNLIPNVNFSTGASRGRFIQIRGVGERSEFVEPVNHSVGVMIDGIDMTGIATAATMLDVAQVEILRGPQGTLYGANALAGLINIVTNKPSDDDYSSVGFGIESFGGQSASLVVSNSLDEDSGIRLAIGQYQTDGYTKNLFLNREDTNNIDEQSLRANYYYDNNRDFAFSSHLMIIDADNGYDAFSLDSNRNTYSDNPGHDKQKTQALAFKFNWQLNNEMTFQANISNADSELAYGYDEDWSHPGICDGTACDSALWGFDWWYASFDNYLRDNKNTSIDLRLSSNSSDEDSSWTLGWYHRTQQVDLLRVYTYAASDFSSRYQTDNTALYGQYQYPIAEDLSLVMGLRTENRTADYIDSNLAAFNPDENLWGGKFSFQYQYAENRMLYTLISRGYKAGGFNTDGNLLTLDREYQTEFMWNYEAGIKGQWLENRLTLSAAIFYQDREDIQIKQSIVRSVADGTTIQDGGLCPCSFTDYLTNAAKGTNLGFELESQWQADQDINFYASLGLLKAEFKDFNSFTHVNADLAANPPVPYNMDGRQQAHAPSYQFTIGINYFIGNNWTVNFETQGKDAFYFSDRHEEKSDTYEIFNAGLAYHEEDWNINLVIHNMTDQDIKTRGFGSFGNDPRKFYETEAYYQFAKPRVVSITANFEF
ncbi:MAG: TonB-dependent receptor [Gammaproteobacteria bacterium]|nr:TonB-dependent receptor [Gammaproteobacteria bacterium]